MHLTGEQIWSILTHLGTLAMGAVSVFFLQIKGYMAFRADIEEMRKTIVKLGPVFEHIVLADDRYKEVIRRLDKAENAISGNSERLRTVEAHIHYSGRQRKVSIAPIAPGL